MDINDLGFFSPKCSRCFYLLQKWALDCVVIAKREHCAEKVEWRGDLTVFLDPMGYTSTRWLYHSFS